TLNKYINLLISQNLAALKGGYLYLRSKKIICQHFGIEYNHHYKYYYSFKGVPDLKDQLRCLALNDNLISQKAKKYYTLKQKCERENNSKGTERQIIKVERIV